MRAQAILRSLPLRQFQPRVAVAPLPEKSQFDRELTVELESLGSGGEIGLAQFLDSTITTQKIAMDSLVKICSTDDVDRGVVDKYLEDNVEILDLCNYFMDKMENIKKYVDSLRVVVHLIESGSAKPNKALEILESCKSIEKKCKSMKNSSLKKMLRQKLCHETELSEIICGSKAMALMCCRFLEFGLSFDSSKLHTMKQFQPTSCSWLRLMQELAKQAEGSSEKKCSLLMTELKQTVSAARELKDQIKGKKGKEMKLSVENVKMCCVELENMVEIVEERVKNLYKSLIDVRMSLLGILSQTCSF